MVSQDLTPKIEDVDKALDEGRLWLLGYEDKWYKVRRNGATKRVINKPGEFRIPCKVGYNAYLIVDELMFANKRVEIRE